jgi:hypothetical protein
MTVEARRKIVFPFIAGGLCALSPEMLIPPGNAVVLQSDWLVLD